jgi:four helix bundle protein
MAVSYRELIVWQKAMKLAEAAYAVARGLPETERYGLSAQIRRSAVSIPSNIAEGHERRSRAGYHRFINIACGSVAELETQLDLACRLHRMDRSLIDDAVGLADEVGRLLRSIGRSLRNGVAENTATYGPEAGSALHSQPSALSPQP